MNLKALTNLALDERVISLAKKEKELLAVTIIHVAEVERRKLYYDFNITSLYAYLTEHAGFPGGSAYRLMDAARLQLEVPELAGKIESGKISMNQVRLVQEAARQSAKEEKMKAAQEEEGNLLDFLAATGGKKDENAKAEADEKADSNLAAVKAQNADDDLASVETQKVGSCQRDNKAQKAARDGRAQRAEKGGKDQKAELLKNIEGLTGAETEKLVAQSFELEIKKPMKLKKQKDGSVIVEMSFSAEEWAEIEKAKLSMSSVLPAGSYSDVLTQLARKENKARAKKAKPRASTKNLTEAKKKFVRQQDECCQQKDPHTGKICGSKFNLQVDHRHSLWAGGTHKIENLQMLCAVHNRLKYEREAGIRRR